MAEKKLLRQEAIRKRNSLQVEEIQTKNKEIAERLFLLPEYALARTILVYLSFNSEVATQLIIERAWQEQKRVLVPVCQAADKSLLLSELRSFSELSPGTWNIPEPKKELQRPVEPREVDLAIIAGVAFDLRGYRLGYGAGYFDRFLPRLKPDCPIVALAYELSIIEAVPDEPHDIPMDYIITETSTYKINH